MHEQLFLANAMKQYINLSISCLYLYARLSSISTLNSCLILKHLFIYKNTQKKQFQDLQFFSLIFELLPKSKIVADHFFILSINNPSLGSCEAPQTILARSVQPFWCNCIGYKRIDKQSIYTRLKVRFAPIFFFNF